MRFYKLILLVSLLSGLGAFRAHADDEGAPDAPVDDTQQFNKDLEDAEKRSPRIAEKENTDSAADKSRETMKESSKMNRSTASVAAKKKPVKKKKKKTPAGDE